MQEIFRLGAEKANKQRGRSRHFLQPRPRQHCLAESVSAISTGKANKKSRDFGAQKSRPFAEGVSFPLKCLYRQFSILLIIQMLDSDFAVIDTSPCAGSAKCCEELAHWPERSRERSGLFVWWCMHEVKLSERRDKQSLTILSILQIR
jgi:hypothetical protein